MHGRFLIGHDTVDEDNTPSLPQIRARDRPDAPPVRPRLNVAQMQVEALQVSSALLLINSSATYCCFAL
jgi:hypothetical protein